MHWKMLKAILFDLDGTIIDTEKNAAEAVYDCFRQWGIHVDPADATYVTGRTWDNAFEFLFKKYPLPIPAAEAATLIKQAYRDSIERNLIQVPGSVQAIRSLAGKYRMALVSGSSRSDITWALKTLGVLDFFEFVLGAEDYPRSKPAPDGYLRALEIMKVPPDQALIFEDSEAGIRSALSTGSKVVAITGTNHFAQDHSKAHHRIPDLTCVNSTWIEELMRRKQK
jgi:HAD superfamily hydrolase (TIGR01509 family)